MKFKVKMERYWIVEADSEVEAIRKSKKLKITGQGYSAMAYNVY